MKVGWCVLFFVTIIRSAWGQVLPDTTHFRCGTEPLTPTQRKALELAITQAVAQRQAEPGVVGGITYVPIRPHIFRQSDGTGGYSLASLNNVIALTNSYYRPAGIQFFFSGTTPDYIDNDELYTAFTDGSSESAIAARNVTNALNQYYVQAFSSDGLGGYAYFPANSVRSTQSFIRVGSDSDLGNRLIPHELGHNFNLIHTFETSIGYEQASGANCKSTGDLVSDTPADPYGWPLFPGASSTCVSGCPSVYTCTFTESGTGTPYKPSPTNIMSYYFPCNHDLTPGQYRRITDGLTLRQTHTAYSLTAPSTNVSPISDLSAAIVNAKVVLSWTDQADNEMGYFIERSTTTDPSGFVCIGGVAPDSTTFTDTHAPSATVVYYRVRPSNSTGNLSTIISLLAPTCQPTYAFGCRQYATGISGFTVNSQVLSRNSGCTTSGVGQFTAVAAQVTPGRSYTFAISLINRANPMRVTVWADFNRNGSFSDAGEQVYQTPTSTTSVITGSLSIPATIAIGRVPIRIVSVAASSSSPNAPCGDYDYGEAEDYELDVRSSCTMASVRNGTWTDPSVWSCSRIPAAGEAVTIGHTISIPDAVSPNSTGQARQVILSSGGQLVYSSGGILRLN